MAAAKRFTAHAVVLAIAVMITMPTVAMAAEHIVGDTQGWNTSVDYKKWAADKEFYVGDILVFCYNKSHDNVIQVRSGSDFVDCIPLGDILDSGNDTVVLDTVGKRWFISGVATHCADFDQKVVINVEGAPAPGTPPGPITPTTPNPSTNAACSVTGGSIVAAAASVALAIVLA